MQQIIDSEDSRAIKMLAHFMCQDEVIDHNNNSGGPLEDCIPVVLGYIFGNSIKRGTISFRDPF